MLYHAWQQSRGTWHNMSRDAIIGRVVAPFVRSATNYEEFLHEGTPRDLRVFRSERRCIDLDIKKRVAGAGDPAIEDCTAELLEYARGLRILEDGVVTTPGPTGEIQHIIHQDTGAFSESRVQADAVTFSLSGRMPRQEEGSAEVCTALAEAKSTREGTPWVAAGPMHDGDDGCVMHGNELWAVQVTRANPEPRWAQAGRYGTVEGDLTAAEAAAEIWQAIQNKLHRLAGPQTRTILAVSVGMPGLHGLPRVVEEFRRVYGPKLREQVTFPEVWLVGYTPETTHRVHPWPD